MGDDERARLFRKFDDLERDVREHIAMMAELRTLEKDTRTGLRETRARVKTLEEIAIVHEEKMKNGRLSKILDKLSEHPVETVILVAILLFFGYHYDPEAVNLTLESIGNLF